MPGNNVLSWKVALQRGLHPELYPYDPGSVPPGAVMAVLDFKTWAKKIMGVCCYFTEVGTGRKFQLSVYCKYATGKYVVDGSTIDFACCPAGSVYHLTIGLHQSGRAVIEKAVLP